MLDHHLSARLQHELVDHILPFWLEQTVDQTHGGFYGALSNDLVSHNEVPRSAVLCARILWTYSTAYRVYHDDRYLAMARRAYGYLTQTFWDPEYHGVYWSVDQHGRPVNDRKHVYAQAFSIYGLAEFYRATGEPEGLRLAQKLFQLIETHTYDAAHGGNLECCSREWEALDDMRLSDRDLNSRKSMNTLLHLMEAYTNLLRVWPDEELKAKQCGLIEVFLQHIIDPQTHHFKLFFDDAWQSLVDITSPGHDIEGSWLIVEAAEVLGDEALLARTRVEAVRMAEAVYHAGLDSDGAVLHEITADGIDRAKHWWPQAEGVVGFTNAYQLSGQATFAEAAERLWTLIEDHFVDPQHGDWFKVLNHAYIPVADSYKVGPWECPYHHSRVCFEMLDRLARLPEWKRE